MKKSTIISLMKKIAGLALKGMQITAFYLARYSPVVLAFLKATLRFTWQMMLMAMNRFYKLLILLIEFLTPYLIWVKNRIADFISPYYIRINRKLSQWFQVFYTEMDEIALVEDDGNAFQPKSTMAAADENPANFLFEENLTRLNNTIVERSHAVSKWLLRGFELCSVFIDNTLRLILGRNFTEVAFEVVIASPVGPMPPKPIKRLGLREGFDFPHRQYRNVIFTDRSVNQELFRIKINELVNSCIQFNINLLKSIEVSLKRFSSSALIHLNMFLPFIKTGQKANRSGYP